LIVLAGRELRGMLHAVVLGILTLDAYDACATFT